MCHGIRGGRQRGAQAEAWHATMDVGPEEHAEPKSWLAVIRSIIERERGHAVRPWICSLQSRNTNKAIKGSLSPCEPLTGCRRAYQGRRRRSRGLSSADGRLGVLLPLAQRSRAVPMLCKGTVRTASKLRCFLTTWNRRGTGYPRHSVKPT